MAEVFCAQESSELYEVRSLYQCDGFKLVGVGEDPRGADRVPQDKDFQLSRVGL